jgi:3-hydroxyacyl-[acyl-carrier-protein] dehydratase
MRFLLLDRICSMVPDVELTAVKNVSLAEDYLADHFPEFPVLPGVFMIEAATQAGAWLIRLSENYAHSTIVLHEVRAVKFSDFVPPGHTLQIRVEQKKRDGLLVQMRFQGEVDGRSCVSGRMVLECANLADDPACSQNADLAELDQRLIDHFRTQGAVLTASSPVSSETKGEH